MIPPLVTISIVRSISFSASESTKRRIRLTTAIDGRSVSSLIALSFISGGVSGAAVACLSCPLELVKIQKQLELLVSKQRDCGGMTAAAMAASTNTRADGMFVGNNGNG